MMLPTHALGGMAVVLPLAAVEPEFAALALLAGFVGGVFPDLDLYVGHRKTLHYPVYYGVFAFPAAVTAFAFPSPGTVAVAAFLLGAGFHSVADVLGGGLELRPWEGTSSRAVYDHHRGRWLAPRRWVRYDGAPEDLLCSLALGVPLMVTLDGTLRWLVAATLTVALGYAAVRRVLPVLAESVVAVLPATVLPYVPARYRDEPAR